MAQSDSLDKIIKTYFACVTDEPFIYKGESYAPYPLRISPLLFRGFTCPEHCAACCPRFSLDYLPSEKHPYKLSPRQIDFNGKRITIHSDQQDDHGNYHCRNVNRENGRCGIHGQHPFSCDFELIRFMQSDKSKAMLADGLVNIQPTTNVLTQKLYGRAWNMKRIDEGRGTLCEMTPPDKASVDEVVRKLKRLKQWLKHFKIMKHKVDRIIDWAKDGQRNEPLFLS